MHKIGDSIQTDFFAPSGWPSVSGDALKAIAGKVSAEYDFAGDAFEDPLVDESHNPGKKDVDLSAYGTAYDAFGRGKEGMEACHAIAALIEICSIDSLISNFILPLQVNTPPSTFHACVFCVYACRLAYIYICMCVYDINVYTRLWYDETQWRRP